MFKNNKRSLVSPREPIKDSARYRDCESFIICTHNNTWNVGRGLRMMLCNVCVAVALLTVPIPVKVLSGVRHLQLAHLLNAAMRYIRHNFHPGGAVCAQAHKIVDDLASALVLGPPGTFDDFILGSFRKVHARFGIDAVVKIHVVPRYAHT